MQIHYREPKSIQELDNLFQLRHFVYQQDAYLNSMVCSKTIRDINYFDLNALHFGAFHEGKAIAYIRITTQNDTNFTPWVKEILHQNALTTEGEKTTFPFQMYYPDTDWSDNFIKGLTGRKIGEVGKLAIHPDFRQKGYVLLNLIQAFIPYCQQEYIETGFGSCSLVLERYYRKFGFTIAEGSNPFVFGELPEAVIVRFDK